jgi:hypothetical protein
MPPDIVPRVWGKDQSIGGHEEMLSLSLQVEGIKVCHEAIGCTALHLEDKDLLDAHHQLGF